ncbi:SEL1-like repeat protein [Bradyrhizobium sp. Tv2a-2]|uniref:SEL1-like repeat protein n=1 Tax=Bradyrhizobium sp. Tv2a-2 TaxID=113395 RepID=UPI00041F8269|nr:SEL1-like repeat protein [Bradyrhizobium sp. Tv2a-2]
MNSRVWSVDGIDPSVREKAEAAARRAGMSLSDWLNSTLGETTPPNFRNPAPAPAPEPRSEPRPQFSRDVADIHQRLDSITQQIDQISQHPRRNEPAREQGVAHQLNDAISRLDARLSQISVPQDPKPVQQQRERQNEAVERAAAQIYRNSPPLSPFDSAVAEIAARQSELDGPSQRAVPPRAAPPIAPQAPVQRDLREPRDPREPREYRAPREPGGPDFSALERHLVKITSQIEALQRPSGLDQSITAFRTELSEIRNAILEAMPRRAIETIESEVRSLARRIDDSRQNTNDTQALGKIEHALGEIHEVLRTLMPAEQLRGYDEAIRNLGAKLDMILRSSEDSATVQQLESAIAALRGIVSNVASNDALERLAEDVRLLSTKVDQLTRGANNSDSFAILEQRIAALTSALENREHERPAFDRSAQFEDALRGLSDRIDRLQVGNDNAATFAHLEQRVSHLLERIEASNEQRGGSSINLTRVEDALQDILGHLERQHAAFMRLADNTPRAAEPQDFGLADIVKRELSDIRSRQNDTDRQTQDSLEAVHNTLGHVVDRLAMIEGDLRAVRTAPPPPPAPVAAPAPAPVFIAPEPTPAPRAAMPEEPRQELHKPELPNPAAVQPHFVAAPRDFHAAALAAPPQPVPPQPPLAISEILVPHAQAQPRPAIAPELPPDHPLEPGTRPGGRPASPSERIAASEDAISEIPAAAPKPPVSSSSFIAAARRAAQAAAAAQAAPEKGRAGKSANPDKDKKEPSTITSKIRSVLVAASVVVIVLGTFKMAMTLLDGWGSQGPAAAPAVESTNEPQAAQQAPAANSAAPAPTEQVTPQMTSPTPIGKQSFNNGATDTTASATIPQAPATAPGANSDVTGTIPSIQQLAGGRKLSQIAIPPTEQLADGVAGPMLRTAAMKGDATAAYEVAVRYAEGKGVATNYEEAAKWYDRAGQAGLIPATFRLGTLYEKGLGVKKDADIARRYYMQAAERGNAKAMHNLAVLDADGGGSPDYKSAAQWFRKAADHGVADSQFNLGILYARGIGVDQNLAESFKWFSLAAAQGDADAGHKRDDVAKRLDAQSLAAARLAVQTFIAEPQPDDAVNVATPAGGWDAAAAPTATKPATKPAAAKRAAALTTTAAR